LHHLVPLPLWAAGMLEILRDHQVKPDAACMRRVC